MHKQNNKREKREKRRFLPLKYKQSIALSIISERRNVWNEVQIA